MSQEEKIKALRKFLDEHNLGMTACNCCDGLSVTEYNEEGEALWEATHLEHYPSNCEDPSQLERHQKEG